jgi:hypothetical protein
MPPRRDRFLEGCLVAFCVTVICWAVIVYVVVAVL